MLFKALIFSFNMKTLYYTNNLKVITKISGIQIKIAYLSLIEIGKPVN